ncbi:hypothetical protein BLNAU_13128 [Blattamonas nauphoetae]|uniref:Tetratricopeptide repeat protein n=1 Tax=Blattamonas nauphoetae TaxID=2049346 RepID=A0ABQ9XHG1_9EUKA|nr:hypothetical protein BLNAU_13128 [Blattamonas nauphoetae]
MNCLAFLDPKIDIIQDSLQSYLSEQEITEDYSNQKQKDELLYEIHRILTQRFTQDSLQYVMATLSLSSFYYSVGRFNDAHKLLFNTLLPIVNDHEDDPSFTILYPSVYYGIHLSKQRLLETLDAKGQQNSPTLIRTIQDEHYSKDKQYYLKKAVLASLSQCAFPPSRLKSLDNLPKHLKNSPSIFHNPSQTGLNIPPIALCEFHLIPITLMLSEKEGNSAISTDSILSWIYQALFIAEQHADTHPGTFVEALRIFGHQLQENDLGDGASLLEEAYHEAKKRLAANDLILLKTATEWASVLSKSDLHEAYDILSEAIMDFEDHFSNPKLVPALTRAFRVFDQLCLQLGEYKLALEVSQRLCEEEEAIMQRILCSQVLALSDAPHPHYCLAQAQKMTGEALFQLRQFEQARHYFILALDNYESDLKPGSEEIVLLEEVIRNLDVVLFGEEGST